MHRWLIRSGKEGARSGRPPSSVAPPSCAAFHTALEAARRGHGRALLLGGDHGIGKTRPGEQLAREATEAGAEVLVGRCYEGHCSVPCPP
jgi:hypothetical protein